MKLELSEGALNDILVALKEMSERMGLGEVPTSGEVSKTRVALSIVRAQLAEEVSNHEKRNLVSDGSVADAPLDFAEIRDSIGERLDRIRDAHGTD